MLSTWLAFKCCFGSLCLIRGIGLEQDRVLVERALPILQFLDMLDLGPAINSLVKLVYTNNYEAVPSLR
jgi:hypothetical protein